ncbi:MAG TPA: hydroxymethylglutaryl-CoA reductase [Thermoanaerobaculia bacterium]|nr:hydroxymethylglutaryl-CoA reductase [Thermoanaerobaculia bacterium]
MTDVEPKTQPSVRAMGDRDLVPRLDDQGYTAEALAERRAWVEGRTGTHLAAVGGAPIPAEEMRGNVENPIGEARVPLGVAGPLVIHGEHADGSFYVLLATIEGALVRSYERGMVAISRAGGATARVLADENRVSPIFRCADVAAAAALVRSLPERFAELAAAAEATTRHGRLLRIEPQPFGRKVILHFVFSTGDAHGMNMIVKATDAACRLLAPETEGYFIFSGAESEKHASGSLLAGGKGKRVTAGALLPARVVRAYLHATPEEMVEVWQHTVLGHLQAGAVGYNGHFANGLTCLFIACGQDVANVANAAVGVGHFECTAAGDLYASVTLPSLTVATVGGGTGLGTGRECLEMLGCHGAGKAKKLAEIAAALVLAGELSMAGAIASGEFVAAHETYGRNRPADRKSDEAGETTPSAEAS